MSEVKPSPFSFKDFYIKESHFRLANKENLSLNVSLTPRGKLLKSKNTFLLELRLLIVDEADSISIEVIGVATFEFKVNEDDDSRLTSNYFFINAPAIAFPYLRAYVSSLTSQSGYKTITLPALNLAPFAQEIEETMEVVE